MRLEPGDSGLSQTLMATLEDRDARLPRVPAQVDLSPEGRVGHPVRVTRRV